MLCFFDLQTDKAKQEFSLFAFGLYVHSSPGYSRQNLLYLVDHQYYKKVDKEHLRLFLGTIHFEREKDRQSFYLFYGLLFGYEQLGEGYFDVNFLWLRYLNTRDHLRMNFLPVYYYDRTSKETVHVIPPLLSYSSVTQDEVFQLGLLGLGYYRNYNRKEKEDTKAFLLGSVYYESSEKERGYKSRGSLWGVLWQEQSESETGYSKFSVLKILYSQTTINGETRHRIFGIRL